LVAGINFFTVTFAHLVSGRATFCAFLFQSGLRLIALEMIALVALRCTLKGTKKKPGAGGAGLRKQTM
jgi:hypothetical protein